MADPAPPGIGARLVGWASHHIPTRESIERNRWLRPVAHRILVPSLWRFTRRSVPRGVALGLTCGLLFPFAHMPLAATLALPVRANVPVAVGITLINNPVTVGPIFYAALKLGKWILRFDRQVPGRPLIHDIHVHQGWLHYLVAQAGPATIVGLLAMTLIVAPLGYALATLGWRLRVARKWRGRHAHA